MKENFITKIRYKEIDFYIYEINGNIVIKTLNPVSKDLILEVKNLVYDKNTIKTDNSKKYKKRFYIFEATMALGIFIGTYSNKEIDSLKYNDNVIKNAKDEMLLENEENADFDNELFSKYVMAIYSNNNLSEEDKKVFINRFHYINENKNSINLEEILNTLRNIKIIRYDFQPENILGKFIIDENNDPVIVLYQNADEETLIHEVYHALKFNKYYWGDIYFYNNTFIDEDEYKNLSADAKKSCEKIEVLGKMNEEAHTAILTADEENTENIYMFYNKEIYIYKVYESIFGKENMEKIMLSPNCINGFLNNLLEVGCTKNQAIAIVSRMDIYNSFIHKEENESSLDMSYLTYQICDDMAYVYEKKYGNIDNDLLKITILSLTNNLNFENAKEFKCLYNNPDLFDDIYSKNISINNYLSDEIKDNYGTNEYGVNNILIDYFSNENPQIYIEVNNYDKIILNYEKNNITYCDIIGDSVSSQYTYKLYTDYYEFAKNQNNNDETYANYFAAIYANDSLSVEQKSKFIDLYPFWLQYLNDNNSNDIEENRKLLLLGSYQKIDTFFQGIIDKYSVINQSYSK